MKRGTLFILGILTIFSTSCKDDDASILVTDSGVAFDFSSYFNIDFDNLDNYAAQPIPSYIVRDNTGANVITDAGATLGRILFYDKNLSSDDTVSCSTCHIQEHAFSDIDQTSAGVNGQTGRHSMRLINSRFSDEMKFFWDERANDLEEQTTMPIEDHNEMGFSGASGDMNFQDLITKLEQLEYYPDLFNLAFNSTEITEERMQDALAQFIRSIQSFDSKYDLGRVLAANDGAQFANFTTEENAGKQLFLAPPTFDATGNRTGGGIGCAGCHQAPEFSIDPNSQNNGVIGVANATGSDLTVTRAPSLRDLLKADGTANGPFMHIGVSDNFMTVLTHYDNITITGNPDIDVRLRPNGIGQNLNMTVAERDDVLAFIKTLTGSDVYTNVKWSDPFIN